MVNMCAIQYHARAHQKEKLRELFSERSDRGSAPRPARRRREGGARQDGEAPY